MTRKKIVAGNWKMNLSFEEASELVAVLEDRLGQIEVDCEVIIAPPAPYLGLLVQRIGSVGIAAQNCHQEANGAFTGEWSSAMLKSLGVPHCIIGHSERRSLFHEDDALIASKVKACDDQGIRTILCCGETLDQRKAGNQKETVISQLKAALSGISSDSMERITVAYEPVWAIGTGETATSEQAQQMHADIREFLAELYGPTVAMKTRILYGGSVKPQNASDLFSMPDVDGGLVGGASLDADSFMGIISAA